MIEYAYMDLDSVAYVGACIAEKSSYQWFKKDGSEQSELFPKAAQAKEWMNMMIGFNEEDPDNWERKKVINLQSESVAFKGMEYDLNSWIKTAKTLTKNPNIKLIGYLTSSGKKNKDLDHLEFRYQYNRYESRTPNNLPEGFDMYTAPWIGSKKPTHLKACRTHLLTTNDWVKMSPDKIEADAPIVFLAEKRGKKAVIMSKDKDLRQAMGTHFIDMNANEKDRVIELTSKLGYLAIKENARGDKSIYGCGFKLIALQTIIGDKSDGYKGIVGVGEMFGFDLIDPCKTVEEVCEALCKVYQEKFSEVHLYKDWTGKDQFKTWQELLIQHCTMAYHERGAKDTSNPMERYLRGENPIYLHGALK